MGQKNLKGTVSISNVESRIRLRWRYQGKRYSINLAAYTKLHLTKAKTVAALIEKDMAFDSFDYSLSRYKGNESSNGLIKPEKTVVAYFEKKEISKHTLALKTHPKEETVFVMVFSTTVFLNPRFPMCPFQVHESSLHLQPPAVAILHS